MKKQLLFGSALLLSISAYSQSANRQIFQGAKLVEDKRFENRFVKQNMDMPIETNANRPIGPVQTEANPTTSNINASSSSAPILQTTFYRLSGSGNIFGMLVSASKPLNYHRIIETVSFIQRKSSTYVVSPAGDGNTGTIVGYTAKNDAASNSVAAWDSTCIWADPTNAGRYPVGGIWNPGGFSNANSDPNKATIVGMGPVTTGSGWVGSWYASKSLTATPKNAPGSDEQFIPNVSPFNSSTSPTMTKHDFPRYGFNAVTGAIWVAGQKQNDVNGTTNVAYGLRGAALVKGTFVTGAMVWTQDSIIPLTEVRGDGSKLLGEPYMKFDPTGQYGYVMFIGMRQGAVVGTSNRGLQPIVYKTTNSGASWTLVNGIDFSQTTAPFQRIKNTIRSVNGYTAVEAPWFWSEGIDMTIDKNNKLHILSTVIGHASGHVDSTNYLSRWTIGTEDYHWPHVNTARPLIVDYSGDGVAAWDALIIDSLTTEGPSSTSGEPGFNYNPWGSSTAGESVSSDARLQITRSYDGEFLAYSWAESDTGLTSANVKWNEFPNIKVRAVRVCDGSLSPDDLSITSTTVTLNAVKDKSYFHYMSSEMKAGASTANSATMAIPFTVSSNAGTDGILPVNNYFAMSHLSFNFPSAACGSSITTGVAAIKNDATESLVYPNPTENNFNVRLNLSQTNDISIAVYNALGQKVAETKANGNVGENNVQMNMNNANAGVYFVKIKVGKSETTKKLVVE